MMKYVFLLFSCLNLPLFASSMDVFVGESKFVSLDAYSYVEVSRKGFCEVAYSQSKKIWQITGLKPGFVIVSFFEQRESQDPSLKIHVEIKKKPQTQSLSPEVMALCQKKGISCDEQGRLVSGETDDFLWFVYGKNTCKQKHCFFAVSLSPLAQTRGISFLKKEIPFGVDVQISPSGSVFLSRHCAGEEQEQKTWPIFQIETPIHCQRNHQKMMHIYGKVLLMSSMTAKELGLDSLIEGDLGVIKPSNMDFRTALKASIQSEKVQVLAEPNIRVFEGQKAILHSGGEFAFKEEKNDKTIVSWKESGIKIESTVWQSHDPNKFFLDYDFFLKTKEKKDSSSLNSHQFKSKILMHVGESQVVGGAQFEQQKDGEDSLFPLKEIPIIGPLFKKTSGQVSQFQIYLSLEVRRI